MKRIWTIFLLLALLAPTVGCKGKGRGEGKEKAKAEAAAIARKVPVETVEVFRRDVRDTLVSTAAVDARNAVDVVAEVPGVVVALEVEQGDEVEKGQRLAQIRREELNLGVQAASGVVSRLERELARLEPLKEKGVISQQVYDDTVFRLQEARGEERRAKLAAGDTRVTSAMDGVIAMRHVNLGQQVSTGTPLFRIVDPSELVVHVNFPETALGDLFEGQAAYLESEALGGKRFEADVERISPVVDPRTGTIRVTLAVKMPEQAAPADAETLPEETPKPSLQLRPGMFVKAFVVTAENAGALVVPRRAVSYQDDQAMVFVVDDGVAMRRKIVTGISDGAVMEVKEGLVDDVQVVVLGQDGLKDGTPVDPEVRTIEAR